MNYVSLVSPVSPRVSPVSPRVSPVSPRVSPDAHGGRITPNLGQINYLEQAIIESIPSLAEMQSFQSPSQRIMLSQPNARVVCFNLKKKTKQRLDGGPGLIAQFSKCDFWNLGVFLNRNMWSRFFSSKKNDRKCFRSKNSKYIFRDQKKRIFLGKSQ